MPKDPAARNGSHTGPNPDHAAHQAALDRAAIPPGLELPSAGAAHWGGFPPFLIEPTNIPPPASRPVQAVFPSNPERFAQLLPVTSAPFGTDRGWGWAPGVMEQFQSPSVSLPMATIDHPHLPRQGYQVTPLRDERRYQQYPGRAWYTEGLFNTHGPPYGALQALDPYQFGGQHLAHAMWGHSFGATPGSAYRSSVAG
eukprot:CAMPEP_0174936474 /NCGR_PEP_ID=MMETSP1355-20121228/57573_1 /TAXON_ID=464990 /ORGANISM="Hemiselmis tepida, Strain CCMP443" /LENGTH=197 /DNA_ID=CAMNT_0016183255 /DNA_START=168 /DNA_END=757 /DNA_ORIENTATION=-